MENFIKIINKNIAISIILIFVSACNFYRPMFVPSEVPDGPPEFKAGWYDGCRTGFGSQKSANASIYKATFGSGIYQHDPIYQKAWSSAFYTCYIIGGRATANHVFASTPAD